MLKKILSKKLLLVIVMLFLVSCIEKKENELPKKEIMTREIYYNPKVKNKIIDLKIFSDNKSFIIKEGKTFIGTYNISKQKDDKYFFVSEMDCNVIIVNKNGDYINGFNFKGRGLGLLSFVNSYAILDTSIIFYDSSKRKFVEYTFKGKLINEKTNSGPALPYHIAALIKNRQHYYSVGIDNEGYQDYVNHKRYTNFFIFDYNDFNSIKKYSILPEKMYDYLKTDDIAANPISNAFNLSFIDNRYYVNDRVSGEILHFSLDNNNKIEKISDIKLSDEIFPKHIAMSKNDYQNQVQTKPFEWFKSGAFLNNVFSNNEHLIFYTTLYNKLRQKIDHRILFVNKNSLELELIISYDEDRYLKFIDNEYLIFIGYETKESFSNGELTVYKINYKKLF